jgi:RHS repeat-associated protein
MQMQLASNSVLSQPPLAAMPQLSEKPHLGFATKKSAWNPGQNVCNFTVTLGLQAVVFENGVRKTYSARYYNPATGRFLSRDPEDGKATDPKTLHKYEYAGGDAVNSMDPTGRADTAEYSLAGAVLALGLYATISINQYDPYTGQWKRQSGAQTVMALKQLVCPINTYMVGAAEAVLGYSPQLDFVECTARPKKTKCPAGEDMHHLLPQQFESWFTGKGLDINNPMFLRCVSRNCHTGSGGLHSNQNGPGTNWNALWAAFKARNPLATEMEILEYLTELELKFAKQLECNVGTGGD